MHLIPMNYGKKNICSFTLFQWTHNVTFILRLQSEALKMSMQPFRL